MKNQKLFRFTLAYIGLSLCYWIFVLFFFKLSPLSILIYCVLSIISFTLFTQRRYQEIEVLSEYLHAMNRGEYRFDIEQYTEGELSILRAELYKTMVTLNVKNEQLVNQKEFLNQSLADIAHQLRTPITSMILLIDLLDDPNIDTEHRQSFKLSLEKQIDRYRWLVSALLTMSKLDAQVIEFKKTKVYDDLLINEVIYDLKNMIELKDIEFVIKTDHQHVWVDHAWMKEAMINIVKNAIDHSENEGRIEVISSINLFEWKVIVKDYGHGINEHDIKHVFERYYKGQQAKPDSIGIGLAMSKMLIVKQGGEISVTSKVQEFTQFEIKMKQIEAGI